MTLGAYWFAVPVIGLGLSAVAWLALWLTQPKQLPANVPGPR